LALIASADQGGFSYGHTLPGQKLSAMRAEPRVAFA
jgi:hypothetical protein